MNYIHVRNLEKYHPGYKDRELKWAKTYFGLVQGDPEFEMIEDEVDKWRFVALIILELQAKKPLADIDIYWRKKGFDIEKRPMSLTLQVLQNFVEVVTEVSKTCNESVTQRREEKEKIRVREEVDTGLVMTSWNSFAVDNHLPTIEVVTPKRSAGIHARAKEKDFDLLTIYERIRQSTFLLGDNKSKWRVHFDFIFCSPNNYHKILEGNYASSNGGNRAGNRKAGGATTAADLRRSSEMAEKLIESHKR